MPPVGQAQHVAAEPGEGQVIGVLASDGRCYLTG